MSSSSDSIGYRLLLFLADFLGPVIIKSLGFLCRYEVKGFDYLHEAENSGKGAIIALWHGRMLLPVYHLRDRKISALISLHRDGEFIARIVRKLGYITRRGSPKEGGMEGFKQLLSDLKQGTTVAIMPDGPTGPRHSIRDGVIHLARLSGAPIVPVSFSAKPRWLAKSWDRFNVMKPFSRGVVVFGQPFRIPRNFSSDDMIENYRDLIKRKLTAVEEEADDFMKQTLRN